ncbi:hypothetical protein COZ60_00990 [Candidatus Bathyarchaeota archaeon CG_4_8_14_3_um_filter_42_8]|nr:MAG: hypothetical protein COZ60_00990 [Candidatus Bathyarchaeota archaeon CG_4_8_14_3_um_filter_42_8]
MLFRAPNVTDHIIGYFDDVVDAFFIGHPGHIYNLSLVCSAAGIFKHGVQVHLLIMLEVGLAFPIPKRVQVPVAKLRYRCKSIWTG